MSGYWNGSSANGVGEELEGTWWTIRSMQQAKARRRGSFSVERDLINIYFKFKIE